MSTCSRCHGHLIRIVPPENGLNLSCPVSFGLSMRDYTMPRDCNETTAIRRHEAYQQAKNASRYSSADCHGHDDPRYRQTVLSHSIMDSIELQTKSNLNYMLIAVMFLLGLLCFWLLFRLINVFDKI